jgi:uncharacterized LabA/DUF88 family protein
LRVLFLVDLKYLFDAVRKLYGPGARIDFKLLKEEAIWGKECTEIRCILYSQEYDTRLMKGLAKLGYEFKSSRGKYHTRVALVADAISSSPTFDIIKVASGDSDLCACFKALREKKKKIVVIAFPGTVDQEIRDSVDEMVYLDKGILWSAGQKRKVSDGSSVSISGAEKK